MKLSFANDRVLAVMAHPDDAELLCAGTLARARADGAAIAICIMCSGDKGKGASTKDVDLAEIRCDEATAAADVIGAQLYWQGGRDGELFDSTDERSGLIEAYRKFKPTLVITHSPEDYHADHRATSAIAEAASWFAASRGHVTKGWDALNGPPALWYADTVQMTGFSPGFLVDVSAHVETKKQMLKCHRSQLERGADGDFTPLSELMIQQCRARGAQCGVAAAEAFRWHHAFKRVLAF